MDAPARLLSARFKGDFAYPTIKDRVPVILTKAVDAVYRLKPQIKEDFQEEGLEELKSIVGRMSKLKNEIQTDKVMVPIQDDWSDAAIWNNYLEEDRKAQLAEGGKSSWFSSSWLFTECYFYRRLKEAVELSTLKHIDPFAKQKENALMSSIEAMSVLATFLIEILEAQQDQQTLENLRIPFLEFLKISLWGNKCDLSISGGSENTQKTNPVTQLEHLEPNLLCDESDQVWSHLLKTRQSKPTGVRLDIILDNAGFEIFSDFSLVDFVLSCKLADEVHLHGKTFPWFVSDVTSSDFNFTLKKLMASEDQALSKLGKKLQDYMKSGSVVFKADSFWTYPHPFSQMQSVSPELYADLSKADLLVFKGDLNYRKLTGDRKWDPTVPLEVALQGFHPAPLCALRSLKCDTVTGLREGLAEEMHKKHNDWMITGNFAVIQFYAKHQP